MKVLILGMHNRPEIGGVDRYFCDISAALSGKVESFAFGDPEGSLVAARDTRHIEILAPSNLSLPKRLRVITNRLFPKLNDDSVFVSHFALYAFPLRRHLRNRPHIVHFHGPWAEESQAEGAKPWTVFAKKWVERQVYRTANRFICLCETFKEALITDYGIPPEKIEIVPGGVHAADFDTGLSQSEARAELDWPDDGPIFFCVRRLARRMGIDNLIKAFATITKSYPKARLMIGGKGPQFDELRELIRTHHLEDRVKLLGFIATEDLALAYRSADCSIVPSRALEGFGLITLESMAAGTPVLVTPVGGLPSAVEGLDPRLVLDDTDVSALAQGLKAVLSGSQKLPSTEACQKYVRENFDWAVIAPRIFETYHDVFDRHSQTSSGRIDKAHPTNQR